MQIYSIIKNGAFIRAQLFNIISLLTKEELIMKKQLALGLAALLVVGSIAGCSSSSSSDTASTTAAAATEAAAEAEDTADDSASEDTAASKGDVSMVMYWWGNQIRNERTQDCIDVYAEENGMSIDGQFADWDDYWNKLATFVAGGSVPDVLQMDYAYIDQYAKAGVLLDLSPYIESGAMDCSQIDDSVIASGTVDGGVYAICAGINSPALLYNKTLTDSIGLEIKDDMTLDEFYDYCRQIYEETGVKTNISYGTANNWSEYIMRAYDNETFGDSCMAGDASQWVPFFEMYEIGRDEGWMIDAGVFAEIAIGTVEQDPLVYGQTPSTQSWCAFSNSNQISAMQEAAPEGMEIAMTTEPSPDPGKSKYLKSSQFFSVGIDSAYPDEAVAFLNWLINSYEANDILLGERGIPAPADVAEHIAPQMSEFDQMATDYVNNVVTPNCSPINPPQPDGSSEVYNLLNNEVEKVCYGVMNAEEAAEEFFTQANEIMAEH